MSEYNQEQYESLSMVRRHLATLGAQKIQNLKATLRDYLEFRRNVDALLNEHFAEICSQNCYRSRLSACCSREGIITFFADVVINALNASAAEIETMLKVLQQSNAGYKCVYLGEQGCMWRVKPIVCEMFLCERAQQGVFQEKPTLQGQWDELNRRKKRFTWPDRPVLFDDLEKYFMDAGYTSPLMYLHNSPGLLRVKRQRRC
jgi:hypothetical protein